MRARIGYVQKIAKKNKLKVENYDGKRKLFGFFVFKSKADLAQLVIYKLYMKPMLKDGI